MHRMFLLVPLVVFAGCGDATVEPIDGADGGEALSDAGPDAPPPVDIGPEPGVDGGPLPMGDAGTLDAGEPLPLPTRDWTERGAIDSSIIYTIRAGGGSWYVGTFEDGLWRSDDDGATWSRVAGTPPTVFDTVFFGGVLYLAGGSITSGDAGVYRSSGGGWTKVTGGMLSGSKVPVSLHVHGGTILAGGQEGHIARSANGTDWSVVAGIGDFLLDGFTSFGGDVYAASMSFEEGGVYRSTDDGRTWMPTSAGIEPVGGGRRTANLGATSAAIFATSVSMYRSTDGASWMPAPLGALSAPIEDPVTADDILYGLADGVFGTADHGVSWTDLTANLSTIEGDAFSTIGSDGRLLMVAIQASSERFVFYTREL